MKTEYRQSAETIRLEANKDYTAIISDVSLEQTEDKYRFVFDLSISELQNKRIRKSVLCSITEDVTPMLNAIVVAYHWDFDDVIADYESSSVEDIAEWLKKVCVGHAFKIKTKQNRLNPRLVYTNIHSLVLTTKD